jgi:alkylation response protein AidB-like acyl-CoA dehydrogenase
MYYSTYFLPTSLTGLQVERLYRDVRAYAIPGGSEEIMLDLSIRQALRVHKALGMKL